MKQPIRLVPLALLALLLFTWACNSNTSTTTAPAGSDTTKTTNLYHYGHHHGRPVDKNVIQEAADSFVKVMNHYNITDSGGVAVNPCKGPNVTFPITKYESYNVGAFNHWLDSVIQKNDSAGQGVNLQLKMTFGICTDKFIKAYPEAATMRGRIIIFAVPDTITSTGSGMMGSSGATQPTTGYEVGGLDP